MYLTPSVVSPWTCRSGSGWAALNGVWSCFLWRSGGRGAGPPVGCPVRRPAGQYHGTPNCLPLRLLRNQVPSGSRQGIRSPPAADCDSRQRSTGAPRSVSGPLRPRRRVAFASAYLTKRRAIDYINMVERIAIFQPSVAVNALTESAFNCWRRRRRGGGFM